MGSTCAPPNTKVFMADIEDKYIYPYIKKLVHVEFTLLRKYIHDMERQVQWLEKFLKGLK